jgi:hypothetical protein
MKTALAIASVVLALAGLYCGLWIFSSASLSCLACNCEYSLFAPTVRCRQPYIAMILSAVCFGLCLAALIVRRRLTLPQSR